jgi:Second Messenger Oligonucleotide or Dinucleotide Synthetase domain
MATTVRQAFDQYVSNLKLRDRQETLVSQRRANVVRALAQNLSLHTEKSKLIGSWDRHTLTRYLSEGDVDVMVILHYGANKHWDTSGGTINALNSFKAILDSSYPYTQKRRHRNCITMQFSEFRLDVVPAFKNDGGYYKIPDSIRQQWVKTDPFSFAQKISEVNATMDRNFVPLIKMVKGWNREVGWPIQSFHLECLMYSRYRTYTKSYTYSSMLKFFFEDLSDYLHARCYDPVQGDQVDTYLDEGGTRTRRDAIRKARTAAAKAAEAFKDEDKYHPSIAINEWKALLGEFFPAYG